MIARPGSARSPSHVRDVRLALRSRIASIQTTGGTRRFSPGIVPGGSRPVRERDVRRPMMRRTSRRALLAACRAVLGLLTVVAIRAQLLDLANRSTLDLLNYSSHFAIDSNLIAIVVFLAGAIGWRRERTATMDFLRGAAVVYMAVVGIGFSLLLSNTDVDTALPWVNFVVHDLMPIAVVTDWLIDPPIVRLTLRQGLSWTAFPAVWLAYALIKGPIVGTYPYPFLDPANGGYGTVTAYCLAILIGMTAFCALAVWVGNALRSRMQPTAA